MYDNIVIHYYPESPYIAKCSVNLKRGKKIVEKACLKDLTAVNNWLVRTEFYKLPYRIIVHWN